MSKKLISMVLAVITVLTCMTLISCKPVTYTVTFDSAGGSAVASQIVKKNECAVEPQTPTKAGDTFLYWYLDRQSNIYNFENKVKKDITLKARWESDPILYTLTYKIDDSIYCMHEIGRDGYFATKQLNPTKENYYFVYWSVENQKGPFDFQQPVTKDMTLKPKFVQGQVADGQVKFYYDDFARKDYVTFANLPTSCTANVGDEIQLPIIKPTSSSSDEFYGWVNATTGEKYLFAGDKETEDYKFTYDGQAVVLYAIGKVATNIIV